MQQRKHGYLLPTIVALAAAGLAALVAPPAAAAVLPSLLADPPWCDLDGDGFCYIPFGADCDDGNAAVNPGAEELANLQDDNCSGFADEPPVGLTRADYTMQGAASAVEWYGDYVYLAAASVVQVYYAPPGAEPALCHEIEFRDWVREMSVDGDTLFVAARGDGLFAFDLGSDPSHPQPAGQVSGLYDAGGGVELEAVFNGVDARSGRVAAARANSVPKSQGGVDAVVFDYSPPLDSFTPVRIIDTGVRSNITSEIPISVGLTEDAAGLYLGYGVLPGELVYLTVDAPQDPVLSARLGGVMDIAPRGDKAFVAVTGLDLSGGDVAMLSRVSIAGGAIVTEPIVTNPGSGAGIAVDAHGDLLCFATWSPGRYEDGYNLWAYTNLLGDTPTRIGAAGSMDWIYQLACRDFDAGSDWIYVADEWGGLELWESDGVTPTLDYDHHRAATGALSYGVWTDGAQIYSMKEGAGLWVVGEPAPHAERPAVEWIDLSDPGCACAGCCPPAAGPFPYPPAVFVLAGASNQGRLALFAQDRNTAVPGDGYFMLFEPEPGGAYECIYSKPLPASVWGSKTVAADGEILFVSTSTPTLRLYQHCPQETDGVRFLEEIEMPAPGYKLEIASVAAYQDYLFITEVHNPDLGVPDSGLIHAYRWKQGDLAACPDQPALPAPEYLGSFGGDYIPQRLLVDAARSRLIAGCTSKPTFPPVPGALLFYDLTSFDPADPAAMDAHRSDVSPDESRRVTYPNVYNLLLDGDTLYVVDLDNGLYRYSIDEEKYVGFYPAHRGATERFYEPEMVQSPAGVVPLHHPIAAALSPSGKVLVQEHDSGRVSILVPVPQPGQDRVYLPLLYK